MQHRAGEKEVKVEVGVLGCWTERLRWVGGRVQTEAVCIHATGWSTQCIDLGSRHMEEIKAKLRMIGYALGETIKKKESLHMIGGQIA